MIQSSSDNLLHNFLKKQRRYKYKKGQILLASDDTPYVFYIYTGYVKRYLITNEGTTSIQTINGPTDIFPLTPVFSTVSKQKIYQGPEVYYYEAMTPVEISKIRPDDLLAQVKTDPLYYRDILKEAGNRLHSNIHQLENISLKTSLMRVAHELTYLGRVFGKPSKHGVIIDVQLTHQDLASILNVTRETVSIAMSELKKLKIIKTDRKITIVDSKKLDDIIYK